MGVNFGKSFDLIECTIKNCLNLLSSLCYLATFLQININYCKGGFVNFKSQCNSPLILTRCFDIAQEYFFNSIEQPSLTKQQYCTPCLALGLIENILILRVLVLLHLIGEVQCLSKKLLPHFHSIRFICILKEIAKSAYNISFNNLLQTNNNNVRQLFSLRKQMYYVAVTLWN